MVIKKNYVAKWMNFFLKVVVTVTRSTFLTYVEVHISKNNIVGR